MAYMTNRFDNKDFISMDEAYTTRIDEAIEVAKELINTKFEVILKHHKCKNWKNKRKRGK